MFVCCVREYAMSEDMAYKRIRAARTARRFPSALAMITDGRLHLTAVVLLTPYLTRENAQDLLAEAIRKTKSEIEELLARRFPRPDLPTRLTRIASRVDANESARCRCDPARGQLVPEPVCMTLSEQALRSEPLGRVAAAESHGTVEPNPGRGACAGSAQPVPEPVRGAGSAQLVPEPVSAPPKIVPTSAERFGAQLSFGRETYELLSHVQCLLGHAVPTQDLAQVFHDALEAYARELEKQKYGATPCPRSRQRSQSRDPRYIPQRVKREVWKRDGARCTYVSDSGRRCEARCDLEFDHIEPIARGGESTTTNLRLRCRAHNQLEAEHVFGGGFMEAKRDAAHRSRRESAESEVGAHV
jgi:5-methylcytosine-specific restriction endonuclease McrA